MGTAVILPNHDENGAVHDPLLPWLQYAYNHTLIQSLISFSFFFSNKYVCIYSCSYEFVCKCRSAKKALDEWYSGKDSGATDLYKLLSNCINTFKHHSQYKNDIRFLKIWFLYVINLLFRFPKFDRIVSMV